MYKLVVVGGNLRGSEYKIENGENILGRDGENQIVIDLEGVSKRHLSLSLTGDVIYMKDLGSSNGTYVNGKLAKRATLNSGDRITLPDCVLQLVYVKEKKILIKKKSSKEDEIEDPFTPKDAPKNLLPKLIFLFKYKLMPLVYSFNQEYEWRHMLGIFVAAFSIIAISLTIFPVLDDSKHVLMAEVAKRGALIADEIARTNSLALERKDLDRINTAFVEKIDGVISYELFDLQGRIVRPIGKINTHISDNFSVYLMNESRAIRSGRIEAIPLEGGVIGVGKKINKGGDNEGLGIIALKFAPESLLVQSAKSRTAYFEALTTTFIVAVFFFAVVYYMTVRPIDEIRYQIEESLRGKRRNIESSYLMVELGPLRDSINSILQRLRDAQGEAEDEFTEIEGDEIYVSTLIEFVRGTPGPAIVLNSEKLVMRINESAQDLLGMREDGSIGENIAEVCREGGIAGTILEVCDGTASNNGTCQSTHYELQGADYEINAVALIGKDNFAKAFMITFVRE